MPFDTGPYGDVYSEVPVFDADSQHVGGEHTGRQTVVPKFESMVRALEIYDSREYR